MICLGCKANETGAPGVELCEECRAKPSAEAMARGTRAYEDSQELHYTAERLVQAGASARRTCGLGREDQVMEAVLTLLGRWLEVEDDGP